MGVQNKPIDSLSADELAQIAMDAVGEDYGTTDTDNLPKADIPEDQDNPEQADPEGQPAGEGPEVPEEPEVGDPGEKGGDAPADSGFLKNLRDAGWDHNFKTEREALESLVELRRFSSRKLEHEALGRLAAEAGMTPDRLQAELQQAEHDNDDPLSWRPPVKFDPRWEREIKLKEDGSIEGPPDLVDGFKKFVSYREDYWSRLGNDPTGLVRASRPVIEEVVADVMARTRAREMSQSFLKENGDFIREHRGEFQTLLERGVPPDVALDHLRLKHPGKNASPAKGDPKAEDLKKLKGKVAPRAAPVPVRRQVEVDYASMSEEDLARLALKEKGIVLQFGE